MLQICIVHSNPSRGHLNQADLTDPEEMTAGSRLFTSFFRKFQKRAVSAGNFSINGIPSFQVPIRGAGVPAQTRQPVLFFAHFRTIDTTLATHSCPSSGHCSQTCRLLPSVNLCGSKFSLPFFFIIPVFFDHQGINFRHRSLLLNFNKSSDTDRTT